MAIYSSYLSVYSKDNASNYIPEKGYPYVGYTTFRKKNSNNIIDDNIFWNSTDYLQRWGADNDVRGFSGLNCDSNASTKYCVNISSLYEGDVKGNKVNGIETQKWLGCNLDTDLKEDSDARDHLACALLGKDFMGNNNEDHANNYGFKYMMNLGENGSISSSTGDYPINIPYKTEDQTSIILDWMVLGFSGNVSSYEYTKALMLACSPDALNNDDKTFVCENTTNNICGFLYSYTNNDYIYDPLSNLGDYRGFGKIVIGEVLPPYISTDYGRTTNDSSTAMNITDFRLLPSSYCYSGNATGIIENYLKALYSAIHSSTAAPNVSLTSGQATITYNTSMGMMLYADILKVAKFFKYSVSCMMFDNNTKKLIPLEKPDGFDTISQYLNCNINNATYSNYTSGLNKLSIPFIGISNGSNVNIILAYDNYDCNCFMNIESFTDGGTYYKTTVTDYVDTYHEKIYEIYSNNLQEVEYVTNNDKYCLVTRTVDLSDDLYLDVFKRYFSLGTERENMLYNAYKMQPLGLGDICAMHKILLPGTDSNNGGADPTSTSTVFFNYESVDGFFNAPSNAGISYTIKDYHLTYGSLNPSAFASSGSTLDIYKNDTMCGFIGCIPKTLSPDFLNIKKEHECYHYSKIDSSNNYQYIGSGIGTYSEGMIPTNTEEVYINHYVDMFNLNNSADYNVEDNYTIGLSIDGSSNKNTITVTDNNVSVNYPRKIYNNYVGLNKIESKLNTGGLYISNIKLLIDASNLPNNDNITISVNGTQRNINKNTTSLTFNYNDNNFISGVSSIEGFKNLKINVVSSQQMINSCMRGFNMFNVDSPSELDENNGYDKLYNLNDGLYSFSYQHNKDAAEYPANRIPWTIIKLCGSIEIDILGNGKYLNNNDGFTIKGAEVTLSDNTSLTINTQYSVLCRDADVNSYNNVYTTGDEGADIPYHRYVPRVRPNKDISTGLDFILNGYKAINIKNVDKTYTANNVVMRGISGIGYKYEENKSKFSISDYVSTPGNLYSFEKDTNNIIIKSGSYHNSFNNNFNGKTYTNSILDSSINITKLGSNKTEFNTLVNSSTHGLGVANPRNIYYTVTGSSTPGASNNLQIEFNNDRLVYTFKYSAMTLFAEIDYESIKFDGHSPLSEIDSLPYSSGTPEKPHMLFYKVRTYVKDGENNIDASITSKIQFNGSNSKIYAGTNTDGNNTGLDTLYNNYTTVSAIPDNLKDLFTGVNIVNDENIPNNIFMKYRGTDDTIRGIKVPFPFISEGNSYFGAPDLNFSNIEVDYLMTNVLEHTEYTFNLDDIDGTMTYIYNSVVQEYVSGGLLNGIDFIMTYKKIESEQSEYTDFYIICIFYNPYPEMLPILICPSFSIEDYNSIYSYPCPLYFPKGSLLCLKGNKNNIDVTDIDNSKRIKFNKGNINKDEVVNLSTADASTSKNAEYNLYSENTGTDSLFAVLNTMEAEIEFIKGESNGSMSVYYGRILTEGDKFVEIKNTGDNIIR